MYALGLFGSPLSSALIDNDARKRSDIPFDQAVSELSGSYNGMANFVMFLGPALGSLILGIILSGDMASNPTILTLTMVSIGGIYLISLIFNFTMNRKEFLRKL